MASIIKPKRGYDSGTRPSHRLSTSPEKSPPPVATVTMSRLPIFHDDLSYQDRNRRSFDDMRRQMESDMRSPFAHTWDDEFDRMCGDFYKLRPSAPLSRVKQAEAGFGSRETLEDNKGVFVEDPVTKGRRFEMRFDVKEYHPNDISVQMQNDTLIVEAKHEVEKDGTKSSSQFNRKIQIPKEVDIGRLSSTLSKDGVLTVTAPVPPTYNAVASPPPQVAPSPPSFAGRPLSPGSPDVKFTTTVYTSPSNTAPQVRADPLLGPPMRGDPLLGRSSPIQPGRSSPIYTQKVYMTPAHVTIPQRTASPLAQASPTLSQPHPPPPGYNQCLNGTGSPVKVVQAKPTPPLEEPTFYSTERGCELVLLVEIGKPYTPEDIKVKVDGLTISVVAEHEEKVGKRTSKSSTSRDFEISQNIDPETVTANLKAGLLEINALASK